MRGSTEPQAGTVPWPALAGLAVLWVAAALNVVWVFAALFIGWAVYDISTGESHFIQRVTRRDHAWVFWAIVVSWIAMSALWIIAA